MIEKSPLFIAIEGPIGVGKTSLANYLASHYSAYLLKEIVYENPFLDRFYEDVQKWSFQTEMFFLTNRYQQLIDVQKQYLNQNFPVISDYHLIKSLIFSQLTLDLNHLTKFKQIYSILESDLSMPNVIIVLNASLETVIKRIKKRNRDFEQNIDIRYLEMLIESYHQFVTTLKRTSQVPIIELDGDYYDFVKNPEDLQEIIAKVDLMIHKEAHNED